MSREEAEERVWVGGDHGSKHAWEVRVNSGERARVVARGPRITMYARESGGCLRRVLDMDTVLRVTGTEYRELEPCKWGGGRGTPRGRARDLQQPNARQPVAGRSTMHA